MAEINLGKVRGDEVTKQSITSALGFPVKDIVFMSQSEYDTLPPDEQEGERLFFIKDKLGKIFYKNQLVWDLPWDGTFADPLVGQILFDAGLIASPTKSTNEELAMITNEDLSQTDERGNLQSIFTGSSITSFDEFQYFTGVTSLGRSWFRGCSSLTSITIPESVTSLERDCFRECLSLTSITIPESVTSLGNGCFEECSSLTSITLPEGLTSLGNSCFDGCSSLASITLPEGLTSLGEMCFRLCPFTSITLPEGLTRIGAGCFGYCEALTSITIPESVTSIEDWGFYECPSLTLVTVLPANPPSLGSEVFFNVHASFNIKVRSPYVNTYKTATGWTEYADKISAI